MLGLWGLSRDQACSKQMCCKETPAAALPDMPAYTSSLSGIQSMDVDEESAPEENVQRQSGCFGLDLALCQMQRHSPHAA